MRLCDGRWQHRSGCPPPRPPRCLAARGAGNSGDPGSQVGLHLALPSPAGAAVSTEGPVPRGRRTWHRDGSEAAGSKGFTPEAQMHCVGTLSLKEALDGDSELQRCLWLQPRSPRPGSEEGRPARSLRTAQRFRGRSLHQPALQCLVSAPSKRRRG